MDYSAFALYFAAVVAYTIAPGPMMAMIITRTLGSDIKGATSLAAGFCMGRMITVLAVAFGVGVWAQSRPDLWSIGKYLGAAYLMWLAVSMWNGRASNATTENQNQNRGCWASVGAGITLTLGNPSSLLIYMVLLPIAAPAGYDTVGQIAGVTLLTGAAVGMVFFGTILLTCQIHGLLAKPASKHFFGRIASGTLALTSVWMLAH